MSTFYNCQEIGLQTRVRKWIEALATKQKIHFGLPSATRTLSISTFGDWCEDHISVDGEERFEWEVYELLKSVGLDCENVHRQNLPVHCSLLVGRTKNSVPLNAKAEKQYARAIRKTKLCSGALPEPRQIKTMRLINHRCPYLGIVRLGSREG